jgi:hypothetical protein
VSLCGKAPAASAAPHDWSNMDTFIQPKITGYRLLTPEEAALMNEGKALAEQCGAFIAKLREHTGPKTSNDDPARLSLDQRWISIGSTQLQQGFMAVIRGIAQPTSF